MLLGARVHFTMIARRLAHASRGTRVYNEKFMSFFFTR